MVDKPGRRKKQLFPWRKVATPLIIALIVGAAGYFVYENYIYTPPPVYARIDTTDGAINVELFPACAPQTVANFVNLAKTGFYNDLVWHRIVDTPTPFVIQTGDPNTRGGLDSTRNTWGQGGSSQTVPLEVSRCEWIGNYQGYLGMARQSGNVNSGTSQFYVNLSNGTENLGLNGNYTVFGKVISGWSVVEAIAKSPLCLPPSCPWTVQDEPLPPVFMNDVVVLGTANPAANSTS